MFIPPQPTPQSTNSQTKPTHTDSTTINTPTRPLMKIPAFAAALLLALATTTATAAPEPKDLWVAILGYRSKSELVDRLMDVLVNPEDFVPTYPGKGVAEEVVTWYTNCLTGSYVNIAPVNPIAHVDFSKIKISERDARRLANPDFNIRTNEDDRKVYKKILTQSLDAVRYEYKVYWLSDEETMAKPKCASNAIEKFIDIDLINGGLFEVIKYEKVSLTAEQFNACVVTEQ